MDVKFLNQPKEVKLGDMLKRRLNENFKAAYLIAGMTKDTAIEDLLPDLEIGAKNFEDLNLYIGIDRKNTSKDMLLKVISAGCKLHVHINTDDDKVETRAYVFEGEKDSSYIYIASSKFSSGGLFENTCIIAEVKYLPNEKKEFETAKNNILQGATAAFELIDRDEVILLAEKGEIVARITDRKIPKITEMYGATEQQLGEQVYDESASTTNINFAELADIDIEFDMDIGVRKNVELESEKEAKREQKEKEDLLRNLKKTESDLDKLYSKKQEEQETKPKTIIHKSDELNYEDMTTLIIGANKIIEKGLGAGEFKIPKSLSDNMTKFFGTENCETDVVAKFEIMDNRNNIKVEDDNVLFLLTDKGMSIKSEELIRMKLEEGDLVRLIKESNKLYKCEVIRKDTEEYNIWNLYCKNSIRGNKRRFGII